jgi:hypothetical protein
VPAPYGGFNLNSMDAHGGWVANAADLVRFSSSFDVMTNSPLLSSNWIRQMWSAPSFIPTNAIQYYADGWNVRSNYDAYIAWHDGALPGTYAFTARGDGICYAMVFNKRYSDVYPATNDDNIVFGIEDAIFSIGNWPDVNLFNRVVTTLADSGPGSLREAVSSVAAGSTITFVPGLSGRTITLTSGELLLTENLTIDASSLPAGIRISGNNSSRVFNVAPGVTASLTGLTIQNGYAPNAANPNNYGGGILNRGALTLTDCTVTACRALQGSKPVGGGIGNFGAGATLTLQNCTISSNQADAYGGGINISSGAAILNQCTFAANFSSNYGGGVSLAAGSLFINQCTVASNSAAASGGIHKETGSLTVSNSIVAGNLPNTSTPYTGGYNLTSGNPSLAPLANYGGPMQTMPPLPGSPAIDAGAATTLATDQRGLPRSAGARVDIGAVELQAPYPVVTSTSDSGPGSLRQLLSQVDVGATLTFAGHLSGKTIALTSGQLLLSNILIIDASALPGGISISGTRSSRVFEIATNSTVVLNSLTITNGSNTNSVAFGGGMYSSGTLTLNRCTFSGNSAAASGGGSGAGGGLYVRAGVATLNSCTLSGNHAGAGGGAIANPAGVLTLNQCTLAGNSADGSGGAISFGGQGGTVSLNQCTVSQNSAAASAGGISHAGSTLAISNSIVAGNAQSSSGDINGAGTFTGVNLTNGTPLLAPLANYGGPTQTMPPLPGSPVVDGCTGGTSFATDQRGKPRIVGAYADIGAVEGVFNPVFPLVNVMKLGSGNVRFRFTNLSGPSYTVLATTNLAAPLNTWSNLGTPTESPAGTFTFTDLQATNNPQRFYHVRGP